MSSDPVEREREFRKRIEQAALAQRESRRSRQVVGGLGNALEFVVKRFWIFILTAIAIIFPLSFLFIFGMGIKWTEAYGCSVAVARRSPTIVTEIGDPIETGFFAWSFSYLNEASTTDASFSTDLSGPKGEGELSVRFYRSPVGSSLTMDLEKEGSTHVVHRGPAACPR